MPRTILAGNWKMHKTVAETLAFIEAFLPLIEGLTPDAEIVIAAPFTALRPAGERLAHSRVRLGAQTMHWENQGAFTGEIAPPMLVELGVSHVILGHSERRAFDNESDANVNRKVRAALAHGLTPIVAVGETLAEHEAGATDGRVSSQTRASLAGLNAQDVARVVVAYEPVWAIGTGRNCDPAEADRVMASIRGSVTGLADVPILYGGSMKADNVAAYLEQTNVNGGLIGGASLDASGFASLIANAGASRAV